MLRAANGQVGTENSQDIAIGGYYGTSALLHELVEMTILLQRDPGLLEKSPEKVRHFLNQNPDAHVQALIDEYIYLKEKIRLVFGKVVSIGALIQTNASKDDLDRLIESDAIIPVFEPTASDLALAAELLAWLQALGKEMP